MSYTMWGGVVGDCAMWATATRQPLTFFSHQTTRGTNVGLTEWEGQGDTKGGES